MLFAFWLLLFLYVGLILVYFATKPKRGTIEPWPILVVKSDKNNNGDQTCKTDADCDTEHVCMMKQCIPKLPGIDRCNLETGNWIPYYYQGIMFAICACSEPHLIGQKVFGGNCDVQVGCGVHGHYVSRSKTCKCDPGYKAVGLTCKKLPAIESINLNPCDKTNEMITAQILSSGDDFDPEYLKLLKSKSVKCVKRPCTFDALSGKPLEHGEYKYGWGCVCDPRYGLFGVVLEGNNKKYTKAADGYDACASIFSEELRDPIDVKLVTYFYLGKREPVSFIVYDDLREEDLVPLLKGSTQLILGQKIWQNDYAQYFFNENPNFRARTRCIREKTIFNIEEVHESYYEERFFPMHCHVIPNLWRKRTNSRVDAYDLLYHSPVCLVTGNDPKADKMFYKKIVTNPLHLTFNEMKFLHRYNAFVLHYEAKLKRWTLDLDYDYNADKYAMMDTNAPKYDVDTTGSNFNVKHIDWGS